MVVFIIYNTCPPLKSNLDINYKKGIFYKLTNKFVIDRSLLNKKSDKNKPYYIF